MTKECITITKYKLRYKIRLNVNFIIYENGR